jgi:hypothetical protein
MRTLAIQADRQMDRIFTEWLAHLVLAIPAGPQAGGLKIDGDLHTGIIVNQRHEGRWTVSFRPHPDGSRLRTYASPQVVARVIINRAHDEDAALDLPAQEDVTDEILACTSHPAEGD